MDQILLDPDVRILTCWPYAHAYALKVAGRSSIPVGLPLHGAFYYDGCAKRPHTVAYMPRRGADIAAEAERRNPSLTFVSIDGLSENETAATMKRSEVFIATSVNEQFGLPAFEAMAAAAVVISVPVIGGMDYLRHGENCIIAEPGNIAGALADLVRPEQAALRARLRFQGRITAMNFLESRQREHIRALLGGDLSYLKSGVTHSTVRAPGWSISPDYRCDRTS